MELHPRNSSSFVGNEAIVNLAKEVIKSEKIPHAWLLSGEKGIGKASFAYRLARYFLSPDSNGLFADEINFDIAKESQVFHFVANNSHPDLLVLETKTDSETGKVSSDIGVDEARKINNFLRLTSGMADKKIVIIDSVDEMNVNAANAILKLLEEPPKNAIFFLISHNPYKLLPTIKSRCFQLKLNRLENNDVREVLKANLPEANYDEISALSQLAAGSPGYAIDLYSNDGLNIYNEIIELFTTLPSLDGRKLIKFSNQISAKDNANAWRLACLMIANFIHKVIYVNRSGEKITDINGKEQDAMNSLLKIAPAENLPDLWFSFNNQIKDTNFIHLDKVSVILTFFEKVKSGRF